MSSILINPVKAVFVPFEIPAKGKPVKRDDLPRFVTTDEVYEFMQRHPEIHRRHGEPVHLQWIEHDEEWAILEYHKGVGNGKWQLS